MQINGELISEAKVEELLPTIYDLCETHNIPATFFEITTALAFKFFADEKVDVVVLETGLGGRLDATNVLRKPELTIITSIGLEHTRILGSTLEQIASEKAGIMKRDVPIVVGPHALPAEVLRQCALEKGAGPYYTTDDVLGKEETTTREETAVTDYDQENARIARAALTLLQQRAKFSSLTDQDIQDGTSLRPPCRFEVVTVTPPGTNKEVTVVLDVAHNPPAMEHLVHKLQAHTFALSEKPKFRMVVGMSSDKNLKLCSHWVLEAADGDVSRIHLVQAQHPRAATVEKILEAEPKLAKGAHYDTEDTAGFIMHGSITHQVQSALQLAAANQDEILVVCGSVFLMAESREALGFEEPRDSECIAEMAGCNLKHGQEFFGNMSSPSSQQQQEEEKVTDR